MNGLPYTNEELAAYAIAKELGLSLTQIAKLFPEYGRTSAAITTKLKTFEVQIPKDLNFKLKEFILSNINFQKVEDSASRIAAALNTPNFFDAINLLHTQEEKDEYKRQRDERDLYR